MHRYVAGLRKKSDGFRLISLLKTVEGQDEVRPRMPASKREEVEFFPHVAFIGDL